MNFAPTGRTFSAPLFGDGEPQLLEDVTVGGQFLGIEFAQGRADPFRLLEGEVEVDAVFLGAGGGGGGPGDLHGSTLSCSGVTLHRIRGWDRPLRSRGSRRPGFRGSRRRRAFGLP